MKRRFIVIAFLCIAAAVLSACNLGIQRTFPTPTAKPQSGQNQVQPSAQQGSQPTDDPIAIESTNSYLDSVDDFYVTGLVKNTSSQALSNITLTLEIRDASGKSLITDDNGAILESTEINPILTTIGPGEESPLSYYITPPAGTTPVKYTLTYKSSEPASTNRGNLALEHSHFTNDGSGVYYIFGELVNKGSQPVKINSLAGALMDGSGNVLAANSTLNLIEYLAASGDSQGLDRMPFGVMIYAAKNSTDATKWNIYLDEDTTNPLSLHGVKFTISTIYRDSTGSVHVVGTTSHGDSKQITYPVQGYLTDKDGNILDTYFYMFPINIDANTTLPYDINTWGQINYNETDKSAVEHAYVQVDPSWIWETNDTYLLGTENGGQPTDKGNGEVQVTGTAINSTGATLKEMVVMITFFDANKNVAGTGYESLYPTGDTFTASETAPFDFSLYLDPGQEYTAYDYQIQVIGIQATQ